MNEQEPPRIQAIKMLRGEIQTIFRLESIDEKHEKLTRLCRLLIDYSKLAPHDIRRIIDALNRPYN